MTVTTKIVLHKGLTAAYTGPKLDKGKGNWREFDDEFTLYMQLNLLLGYIDGSIICPKPEDADGYANYQSNDRLAAAAILSNITIGERDALDRKDSATDMYKKLKERHQSEGAIKQTNLILDAFGVQIPPNDPAAMLSGIQKISDCIKRAFTIGKGINEDTLLSIAFLYSVSTSYPHLRTIITRELSITHKDSSDHKYAPDIRALIEREASAISLDRTHTGAPAETLAVQFAGGKGKTRDGCAICHKKSHSVQYCVRPGGGMEGKTIDEAREKRIKDREARSGGGANPGKSSNKRLVYANGQAFLVDAGQLTTVDSTAGPSRPEFVGLASASIEELSHDLSNLMTDADKAEYDGWACMLEEETGDFVGQASTTTTISISSHPFFLDSGATVHISPSRSDFTNLRTNITRSVRGVGGSTIMARGVGDILLKVDNNNTVTLKDALFIPESTVRLVSISSLARDSGLSTHFYVDDCTFVNPLTGTIVATGHRSPDRNLYALNVKQIDTAFAALYEPDLGTWHRRLGHANYQAVMDMARLGTVEGTSISSEDKD